MTRATQTMTGAQPQKVVAGFSLPQKDQRSGFKPALGNAQGLTTPIRLRAESPASSSLTTLASYNNLPSDTDL